MVHTRCKRSRRTYITGVVYKILRKFNEYQCMLFTLMFFLKHNLHSKYLRKALLCNESKL